LKRRSAGEERNVTGDKTTANWNSLSITTGTISESFRKYLNNIPGKHEIKNYRNQPNLALYTYFE
jgi:hypothetical protein